MKWAFLWYPKKTENEVALLPLSSLSFCGLDLLEFDLFD